ncbi:MAG: DUF4203 domain-containing protein [Deltaproteobacteria bacterium]|jgi:hypothetical protein
MSPVIADLIIGIALLAMGRRLFWVFVGSAGFILGLALATHLVNSASGVVVVVAALVGGVVGLVLVTFAQQLAIGLAGFVLGGYAVSFFCLSTGLVGNQGLWLTFIAGGIVGLVLVFALFDFALIFLSSLGGAALIIQSLDLSRGLTWVAYGGLIILGVALQTGMLRRRAPRQSKVNLKR